MSLTAEELQDFRDDIADVNGVFSDVEIQRLYTRAGESYNKAVVRAIDQLIANSAKLSDYTQNQSQEKRSQVFDHLLKLRSIWQGRAEDDDARLKRTARILGFQEVPADDIDKPEGWD